MALSARSFTPHPLLQPYVAAFRHLYIDAEEGPMTVDLFPVGHSVISFALDTLPVTFKERGPVAAKFNLTGQLIRHHRLEIQGHYSYVYVVFKPYGAHRLLHFSQHLLKDNYADILDIAGSKLNGLFGRLVDHSDRPEAVVRILEEWLLSELQRKKVSPRMEALMYSCEQIMNSRGGLGISHLADMACMSKSTLERHFNEIIGLSPKLYSRIVRFNHIYKTIQGGRYSNWQDIVHQYDYFDQSHFIHDFKTFFDSTPSQVQDQWLNSSMLITPEQQE